MKTKKAYILGLGIFTCVIACIIAFFLFAPISKKDSTVCLYLDDDDTIDSVSVKLDALCHDFGSCSVMTMARHTRYADKIRSGRYEITPSMGAFTLFRHLKNGQQTPVRLVLPSVRTKERLADELSGKLMMSKDEILNTLEDNDSCAKYDADTATIMCLFIPNTYEVYWNISLDNFIKKMQKESTSFWNGTRQAKADGLGLTTNEVITLASIVDEETANNGEKPMIAGMYYNRLRQDMPLQAAPTVKFALGQFELKRIYNNMLKTDSPYNTYTNKGLPPGPIRIPSVAGIDAVLNLVHHDYIYMCAKEDFSGTHNFARTYAEHLANAAKYSAALNARSIK